MRNKTYLITSQKIDAIARGAYYLGKKKESTELELKRYIDNKLEDIK